MGILPQKLLLSASFFFLLFFLSLFFFFLLLSLFQLFRIRWLHSVQRSICSSPFARCHSSHPHHPFSVAGTWKNRNLLATKARKRPFKAVRWNGLEVITHASQGMEELGAAMEILLTIAKRKKAGNP